MFFNYDLRMITKTAPIALFCFKRLNHLILTVNSLKANKLSNESCLYFFSDAPKKFEDVSDVQRVREYLRTITGFSKISIIERKYNLGLSQSIIFGVSEVLQTHEKVIVIEDDLELSPYFLDYMNDALDLYQNNPQVASIHGYTLPVKAKLPDTFFLKGADCWGWGTWKRAWDTFEQNGSLLLNKLQDQKLIKQFDFDGLVGNSQMLKDQISGKNDSWAIRWHASCFLNNMLTLNPGKSLVKNIGFDGTGEHCNSDNTYETDLIHTNVKLELQPILESEIGHAAYKKFYQRLRPAFLRRVLRKVKSFFV